MKGYELSPEATDDLQEIWVYIANDNPTAADQLEDDIYAACELLAKNPRLGHRRSDLTDEPVLFWPVRGQYMVIYLPDTEPLRSSAFFRAPATPRLSFKRLDRAALVHRTVALRHLVKRQGQVEDFAGIDLPVPHQANQLRPEAAHRHELGCDQCERTERHRKDSVPCCRSICHLAVDSRTFGSNSHIH
jgi:toxin ParE1/3/4